MSRFLVGIGKDTEGEECLTIYDTLGKGWVTGASMGAIDKIMSNAARRWKEAIVNDAFEAVTSARMLFNEGTPALLLLPLPNGGGKTMRELFEQSKVLWVD